MPVCLFWCLVLESSVLNSPSTLHIDASPLGFVHCFGQPRTSQACDWLLPVCSSLPHAQDASFEAGFVCCFVIILAFTGFRRTLYELIFIGPEPLPLVPGQHTLAQREINDMEIPGALCVDRP